MLENEHYLSVSEIAGLCGVGRSTVTYWIRRKRLKAVENGNGYAVAVSVLHAYLKSSGREIPQEIATGWQGGPDFRSLKPCWAYWKGTAHGAQCPACVVMTRQLRECFIARRSGDLRCGLSCAECRYYQEHYLPRFNFIHQLEFPAAVFKGLHFWGANRILENLCGIGSAESMGLGLDEVLDSPSLAALITTQRQNCLGEQGHTFSAALRFGGMAGIALTMSVYPLCREENTFLLMAPVVPVV